MPRLSTVMYYLSKLLPKGWGIVGVHGDGCTVFGLDERERETVGINLVPIGFLHSYDPHKNPKKKTCEKCGIETSEGAPLLDGRYVCDDIQMCWLRRKRD